jgi:hypothetical protein
MRRMVIVLALATWLAVPQPASADTPPKRPGGAPPPGLSISPVEAARSAAKQAELARWLAGEEAPDCVPGTICPQTHTQYTSGFLPGYIYSEAQASYAINWCGPGATASVAAYWSVQVYGAPNSVTTYTGWGGGPEGFMKFVAYDQDEVSNTFPGDTNPYDDITYWGDFIRVTNQQTASTFYAVSGLLGFDDFMHKVSYDLAYYRVPLVPVVDTAGMTGWQWSADHFVTAYGFDFTGNGYIQWGDSAGYVQTGTNLSFGWHDDKSLTTFYTVHMVNANVGYAW